MTSTSVEWTPESVLSDYLRICNRALAESTDTFWLRKAKRLNKALLGSVKVRTLVYKSDPDDIIGEFTLRFDADEETLELLPAGEDKTAFTWKAPLPYLEDVVSRPEYYIKHPLMLDWKWLSSRISTSAYAHVKHPGSLIKCATVFALGVAVGVAASRKCHQRPGRFWRS